MRPVGRVFASYCLAAVLMTPGQGLRGQTETALSGALSVDAFDALLFARLSPDSLTSMGSPEAAAAVPFNPGSLPLAMGETLLGNFIPWLAAEYLTPWKDITRISPTTWKNNVAEGPVWDDNHFHVNMLLHPYQGNFYYSAGRTNGYNFEKSFLFTLVGSSLWECCGESHRPSKSDLVTTTLGGTALGEMIYRWGNQMINRANRSTPPNHWWEVPVGVLSPTRTVTRWALKRFRAQPHPTLVEPQSWDVFASAGYGSGNGFVELGYTYADVNVLMSGARPFDHFETVFELNFGGAKELIGRIQARGSLWPITTTILLEPEDCVLPEAAIQEMPELQNLPGIPNLSECNAAYLRFVPYQGIDYVNNDAYEFGGQTLGAATFATFGTYPYGTHAIVAVDVHGFFGGIQSEYAKLGEIHDRREREREYDFAWGPGFGLAGILSWNSWLRVSGFYRWNHTNVLDGSNVDGYEADHRTKLWGIHATARLLGGWGIGGDYRVYERESFFDNPTFSSPMTSQDEHRWRIFLTYDFRWRRRPLGLFVF